MKSLKLLAAATMLAALAVPATGSADHGADHGDDRCANPYAKLLQPNGGQLNVNGLVVQTPAGQSLTLSTSGTIEVKIEHDCALQVGLVVTKTGPGAPTQIHSNSWSPLACTLGTISETVTIGLDGGTYQFDLNGTSCDGRKLRGDGHGGTVVDPPLPTP